MGTGTAVAAATGGLLAGVLGWAWQWWAEYRLRLANGGILRQVGLELSLILFALFIFSTSVMANIYEWVESERLKFFLEPMFFVFIGTKIYWAIRRACYLFTRR